MHNLQLIFACGPVLSPKDQAVILVILLALLGIGIVTIIFAAVNFVLLFCRNVGTLPHILFSLFYVALSIWVYRSAAETVNDLPAGDVQAALFSIPFLVIGHFCFLYTKFRKVRKRTNDQGTPRLGADSKN